MKKFFIVSLCLIGLISSCNNDDEYTPSKSNLTIDVTQNVSLGDNLSYTVSLDDADFKTLRTQILIGTEKIAEQSNEVSSSSFTGNIQIPFIKNKEDGKATLKIIATDNNEKKYQQDAEFNFTRPDYEKLYLVDENGTEYEMLRKDKYQYEITQDFTQLNAYIKALPISEGSSTISWGMRDGNIDVNSQEMISFTNVSSIQFNTLSFTLSTSEIEDDSDEEVDPNALLIDKSNFNDENNYQIDFDIEKDKKIVFKNFGTVNGQGLWIDEDFFKNNGEDGYSFNALTGKYRLTYNSTHHYIKVEVLDTNGDYAQLNEDGTGTVWMHGLVGKPSNLNSSGWDSELLCFAPITESSYQLTLIAGVNFAIEAKAFQFNIYKRKEAKWEYKFGGQVWSDQAENKFGYDDVDPWNLTNKEELTGGSKYIFTYYAKTETQGESLVISKIIE